MIEPSGAIPRRVQIPFHVRIVREELTIPIERGVKFISKTDGNQFPVRAFRIDFGDPATWAEYPFHETVAIPHAGQEMIFAPVQWDT